MRPGLVVAAIAIALPLAMAAGRPSRESYRSEDALKAKIAELRSEVAMLRARSGDPDAKRPAESGNTASEGSDLEATKVRVTPPAIDEIRALLRSPNRARQGLGLKALGSLSARDERLALLRETLEGADAGLKGRALSLLKTAGGAESVALAVGVLQKEGPSWLRSQAAGVLGELGDAAALPALLDASQSGDLQLRASAVAALDRLGQPAPLQDLIWTLAGLLDHPDGRKRQDAVDLLSAFRTPAVLPGLAKALGDPTDSRVREAAADALGHTRLPEAIPYLEGALQDSEHRVRQAARHALDTLRAEGK